jgi:hypothetical protein
MRTSVPHQSTGTARWPHPKLRAAVRDAKKAGHAYVILDGTLILIGRVAAGRPAYSSTRSTA